MLGSRVAAWPLALLAMASSAAVALPQEAAFTVDVGSAGATFEHVWEECVGSGHASLTLRADWRAHLSRARRDLGVKRTRFHGLLDDDFSVSLGRGKNSYVNLDSLVDFLDGIGMESPFFELSFMPAWLATNTSRVVTHYRGITSPPSNYSEFGQVVESMAAHLAQRYPGKKMMFEVWNEPNGGFWQPGPDSDPSAGQQPAYFELYKVTADALKRTGADAFAVGGPATAGCPGWTADLVAFAEKSSTALDFVSCHSYGGGSQPASVGNLPATTGALAATKRAAAGLPVVITEWSSSWMYTVDYHDEPGSAAFIVAAAALMDGLVDISSYWVFTDVFEEGGVLPGPFHGGFGLLTVHGTPKPAYRAFQLLHGAGAVRLPVAGACPCGSHAQATSAVCPCGPMNVSGPVRAGVRPEATAAAASMVSRCLDATNSTASGLLATRNSTSLRLFLYNHPLFSGTNGSECTFTVTLSSGTAGGGTLVDLAAAVLMRIDESHSNPKAAYLRMGSPVYPTEAQLEELEAASAVVAGPLPVAGGSGAAASFTLDVPANGLAVVDVPLKTAP